MVALNAGQTETVIDNHNAQARYMASEQCAPIDSVPSSERPPLYRDDIALTPITPEFHACFSSAIQGKIVQSPPLNGIVHGLSIGGVAGGALLAGLAGYGALRRRLTPM